VLEPKQFSQMVRRLGYDQAMLFKPKMFLFIVGAGLVLLGAITGLIIGVAGLLGGKWGYAAIGFLLFAVCWAIKSAFEKNEARVKQMLHDS